MRELIVPTLTGDDSPAPGSGTWDLFTHDFCPLHSYMFDRARIAATDLVFDTSLKVEEDYDLLLRLCPVTPQTSPCWALKAATTHS